MYSRQKTFILIAVTIIVSTIIFSLNRAATNNLFTEEATLHSFVKKLNLEEAGLPNATSSQRRNCSKIIPCIVWMLWEQGWQEAPPLQAVCRESWILRNPNYEIRALNLTEAEHLINRSELYPDKAWKTCSRQHMADIIRYELLARYGGIWADASCHCNEPLDNWIDTVLAPQNFFVFERNDSRLKTEMRPWISTWFVASSKDSPQLKAWVNAVRDFWRQTPYPNKRFGYFWPNIFYAQLYRDSADFRTYHENMYHIDADGPHCLGRLDRVPIVYKLKVCGSIKDRIVETFLNGTYHV